VITQDILMEDLVRDYPQVVPMLVRRGVVCIQCGEPVWGTLGEALQRAGIEDREFMMNELAKRTAVSK
jgi:methionine synthase II (cobalamin-independent)